MKYQVVTYTERTDLLSLLDDLCTEAWPEFMLHDPVADALWGRYLNLFMDYQLFIRDGDEILAIVNTTPLRFDGDLKDLPDEGWDWGFKKAIADHDAGLAPNLLMGVQIVVNVRHQGRGLSAIAVREMLELARRKGFDRLIIPVRPSDKHRYPLIPMTNYITWENGEGLPFDNWLRVHVRAGGEIIKVCPQAMRIPGTVAQWRQWTGLAFPGSGDYIVPGALCPVSIDLQRDEGVYVDPNVWVLHPVK